MRKAKQIILIAVFLAVCAAVAGLFSLFTDTTDLSSLSLRESSITFFPDDGGGPYEVENTSDLPIRFDGVYIQKFLIEEKPGGYELGYAAGAASVKLLVDGQTVYSGQTNSSDKSSSVPDISLDLFKENEEIAVEARVHYTNPDCYIFPAVATLTSPSEESAYMASVISSPAILAGISGICFLITVALFLMSIFFSPPDYSLLCLAFSSISFCICRLVETGALPFANRAWTLAHDILYYSIAPMALLFVLLNRKKKIIRYFFSVSALLAGLIILASLLELVVGRVPAVVKKLSAITGLITHRSFTGVFIAASNYLILICVIAALVYHVSSIVQMQAEKAALESMNKAVVSGYRNLISSFRKTAEVRHEWKHDLLSLSLLYEQGRITEIGNYLKSKNDYLNSEGRIQISGNLIFDAVLNSAAARADAEGVKLTAHVLVPSELSIREEDLCQLLMNLFDNSFAACAAADEGTRYIDFSAGMKNGFLTILCKNSIGTEAGAPPPAPEKDLSHGFGLITMKKICSRYGSDLAIQKTDREFSVMCALQTG